MTFPHRRPSPLQTQRNRGPHRHRWERKKPPFYGSAVIGLSLLLLSCLSVHWTWPSSMVISSNIAILSQQMPNQKYRPLRGRWNTTATFQKQNSFLEQPPVADAVIVGSGLAGLTAALRILDRGGKVVIVEKEPSLGGNSNKASSGINGCCFPNKTVGSNVSSVIMTFSPVTNDTLELFYQDTFRSAGDVADVKLIETLVQRSAPALRWLQERVGVDLSAPLVQLGGHSRKRTHRPITGFVGAEIMNRMGNAIHGYESTGYARVLVEHKVTNVVKDTLGRIRGVQVVRGSADEPLLLRSDNVILATGGFASDRSEGSLLRKYRPELQNMATTSGLFSTGDGINLAQHLGAAIRDMEKIQIHPTGFVDPTDPTSTHKTLAAELLRGVGGILLDESGQRFCNELGTRDYVTDKMLEHNVVYRESRVWNPDMAIPTFHLLLTTEAARNAERHIGTYTRKGLITRLQGLTDLARHLKIPHEALASTLRDYKSVARSKGGDVFGKMDFEGLPGEDLEMEAFYVGEVTPVLHYCMGGLKITSFGEVVGSDGDIIPGLYAVGEVTGGVHGNNRLGGNSLLECAVFGTIVGKMIHLDRTRDSGPIPHPSHIRPLTTLLLPQRNFSLDELSQHGEPKDCLVGLHGKVYDLSNFVQRHPGGTGLILSLCGIEATETFAGVHSSSILSQVEEYMVGHLLSGLSVIKESNKDALLERISRQDLAQHSDSEDCWVVIHGNVYDLTEFSRGHPGGAFIIQKMAGKDATTSYQVFHPKEKLKMIEPYIVGEFLDV